MFTSGDRIGSYEVIEFLGSGAQGEVYKVRWQGRRGEAFGALKMLKDAEVGNILKEVSTWARVAAHPNVLTFIAAEEFQGSLFILSEFAEGSDLTNWIAEKGGSVACHAEAEKIFGGILKGLEHLHENGIIHRDIKPANIFLHQNTPLLADFGLARTLNLSQSTVLAGTLPFMSPELLNHYFKAKMGEATRFDRTEGDDLWAAAVTFHAMLAREMPFANVDQIRAGNRSPLPPALSERFGDFFSKAFAPDPSMRFRTAAEMLRSLDPKNRSTIIDEEYAVPPPAVLPTTVKFEPPKPQPMPARRRDLPAILAALFVLAVLLLAGSYLAGLWPGKKDAADNKGAAEGAVNNANSSLPPTAASTKITYSLEGQKTRGGQPVGAPFPVGSGDVFEKDWKYRVNLAVSQSGFFYLFNEGKSDSGEVRFNINHPVPAPGFENAAVKADRPVQTYWGSFGGLPGTEKVWLIWTGEKTEVLERAKNEAYGNGGRVLDPAVRDGLKKFIQENSSASSNPEPVANDARKRVTISGGKVIVRLIELEHR